MAADDQAMTNQELAEAIDALLAEAYQPDGPGAAVVVVKDGETLFRKGYGLANLELGVPIAPDMVFRLASITKQLTAVAILMLAEQGALALDNDIAAFFPDYPTQGHTITVEHLLTHTSGIRSYTSMPEWLPLWRKDFTVAELIELFKDQPMDFAPGEKWAYNNSGYILLGSIIEKVSGKTYEQFLQQQIFEPLGMRHSYYDSTARIIPRRVSGYGKGREGYENAPYLSMTQPHAAGALASSVDDLALWDAGLYTDRLIKPETLRRAFISSTLSDGGATDYGYGWGVGEYAGHRTVEHSGGIHGFRTYALRLPDDEVFVALLTNNGSGEHNPEYLAVKIAALTIGQPYPEPTAIGIDL